MFECWTRSGWLGVNLYDLPAMTTRRANRLTAISAMLYGILFMAFLPFGDTRSKVIIVIGSGVIAGVNLAILLLRRD